MQKVTMVSLVIPVRKGIDNSYELWLQKRESGNCSSVWEFPGGKVEANEDHYMAAMREFSEEVGMKIETPTLFKIYPTVVNEKKLSLFTHISSIKEIKNQNGKWFNLIDLNKDFNTFDINHSIFSDVKNYLNEGEWII